MGILDKLRRKGKSEDLQFEEELDKQEFRRELARIKKKAFRDETRKQERARATRAAARQAQGGTFGLLKRGVTTAVQAQVTKQKPTRASRKRRSKRQGRAPRRAPTPRKKDPFEFFLS